MPIRLTHDRDASAFHRLPAILMSALVVEHEPWSINPFLPAGLGIVSVEPVNLGVVLVLIAQRHGSMTLRGDHPTATIRTTAEASLILPTSRWRMCFLVQIGSSELGLDGPFKVVGL